MWKGGKYLHNAISACKVQNASHVIFFIKIGKYYYLHIATGEAEKGVAGLTQAGESMVEATFKPGTFQFKLGLSHYAISKAGPKPVQPIWSSNWALHHWHQLGFGRGLKMACHCWRASAMQSPGRQSLTLLRASLCVAWPLAWVTPWNISLMRKS